MVLCFFCSVLVSLKTQQPDRSCVQHQQVLQIWKMMKIMTREGQTIVLEEVVNILIADSIGKNVDKTYMSSYPLHNIFLRKIKMWKTQV